MSYAPVPTAPDAPLPTAALSEGASDPEKAPRLARQISASPLRVTSPPSWVAQNSRLYLFGVLALVSVVALVGGGTLGGWSCSGRSRAADAAVEGNARFTKLMKRGRGQRTGTTAKYSTSTYSDGQTSTFVYTTRPIVNPQGVTIGTFTGYQVESSTPASSPTPAKRDDAEPASASPTAMPTYSTSTYSGGQESTFVYTTRPIVNPQGVTIGTFTGYQVVKETSSATTSPSLEDVPTSTVSSSPTAFPTYSTSTYSNGDESTFVYTTRPIVNPQGVTIGTLTGYVHETSFPPSTSTASPTSCSESASVTPAAEMAFDDSHLLHRRGLNFEDAPEHIIANPKYVATIEEVDKVLRHQELRKRSE